jgi:hypothetical protein
MTTLLLILLPCAIAAGCFAAGWQGRLATWAALATLLAEALFVLRLSLDAPVHLLGVTFAVDAPLRMLIAAVLLAVASAYVGWTALGVGLNTPPLMLVVLGFVLGALMLQTAVSAMVLLTVAAGTVIILLLDAPNNRVLTSPRAVAAAVIRLASVVVGAFLLVLGFNFLAPGTTTTTLGTVALWIGLALWLGLIPLHVAIQYIAQTTTPYVYVCAVVVPQVVMLALFERILGVQSVVGTGVGHTMVLLAIGVTVVGAPLLARDTVRRAIAFALLASIGQIAFGMALDGTEGGRSLPLLTAHLLAATLICSSVALLEAHVPGSSSTVDPWRARPIAAAGLVVGLLMLCVPVLGGLGAEPALWVRAWQDGVLASVILALGTVTLAVAAWRIGHAMLFLPPERREVERREQWRRRVAPTTATVSDIASLPVEAPHYVPLTLRWWMALLIVVAVAMAIDTLLPT